MVKMGIIKQLMIKLEEDWEEYQRHRPRRDMEELVISDPKTEIKYMTNSVLYVKGDTLDSQFWRAIRNAVIKLRDCNDDWQFDEIHFDFQKELLKYGIVGKIAVALIGSDDTERGISKSMSDAFLGGYTPIRWDWCHGCWCINDRVIKQLNEA